MKSAFLLLPLFLAFCVSTISCDHYYVRSKENKTCIILDANITGSLYYIKRDNSTELFNFNVTSAEHAPGSCEEQQNIRIKFYPFNVKEMGAWNLTIHFKHNEDDSFRISDFDLRVYLDPKKFNVSEPFHQYVKDEHAELEVRAGKSEAYKCSHTVLYFNRSTTVDLRNIRLIAYASLNTTKFPENMEYDICQLDVRTSDLVPIVVGACLATLVIVVLIAYLIGRARAKRQGYASV